MPRFLLLALCLLVSTQVEAQTATDATRIVFDQQAASLAAANALTYRAYGDNSANGVVVAVTCTGTAAPFTCAFQIPAFQPGPHTVQVTAANAAGESGKSAPVSFTFVVVPSVPQNVRIQ